MTEREKRIEELGTAIEQLKCGKYHDCSSCDMKDYMFCQSAKLAKELYDAGYRKVPEGGFILTREQQIDDIKAQTVAIDNARDVARKETAKRFLKMLYDMGVDRQTVETCGIYDVNGSALARFVSQEFGVEVDE